MTDLAVALESILPAFQGQIPTPIATASADGTPNCTYLSIVWYIDEERIAISNQFLGKTAKNLRENPLLTMRLIDPTSMIEYELDATYLRSETSGEVFAAVRAQLEAVAVQSGSEGRFHLRSVEVLRVDRCSPAYETLKSFDSGSEATELLSDINTFMRRLSECGDLSEATRVGLQAIEDLFGFDCSMLFLLDETNEKLLAIATNGYAASAIDSEVLVGEGAIGVAAHRRRQIHLSSVDRLVLGGAARAGMSQKSDGQPQPGLDDAQSMLATPLILHDRILGVLYLDSSEPGRFDSEASQLIEVLAGHFALTVAVLDKARLETLMTGSSVPWSSSQGSELLVAFHEHDGSILVDGDYVIKGVPGRILFMMLSEHHKSGRTEFTNREIRLNESIELPVGKDNLESRLLTLRKRLAYRSDPFRVERVGRGRLQLFVDAPLKLVCHEHRVGG